MNLDDEHGIKIIGEPGFAIAAMAKGKQVIVDNTMKVADHDFTKCSLIPSGQIFQGHYRLC